MVCDEAAEICSREGIVGEKRVAIMLGALAHDIGKPEVTKPIDGRIRSKGHGDAGVALVSLFLAAFGLEMFAKRVEPLVKFHMEPYRFWANREGEKKYQDSAFLKLARVSHPTSLGELSFVAEADMMGRGPFPFGSRIRQPESCAWFREEAKRLGVLNKKPNDVISGNELIPLGYKPGPIFGLLISGANALQDDFNWTREKILEAFKTHPKVAECRTIEEIVSSLRSLL